MNLRPPPSYYGDLDDWFMRLEHWARDAFGLHHGLSIKYACDERLRERHRAEHNSRSDED